MSNEVTLKTCEDEYAKDPKIKKADILQLLEWRDKLEHLPQISEFMIILFYKCCEYSLEKSKQLINFHYTYRSEAPELFTGRDYEPPKYKHKYFDVINFYISRDTTPEGYRIIYTSLKDHDPAKYNFTVAINMLIRLVLTEQFEGGSCSGYVVVWNVVGAAIGHLATEAIPIRIKKVHIVNPNPIFSKIMFMSKPFMKKELFDLIQLHLDRNTLFQEIAAELLPTEIEGKISVAEASDIMKKKVLALWDDVTEQLKLRADMSKIPASEVSQFTTMNGSFKKLELD